MNKLYTRTSSTHNEEKKKLNKGNSYMQNRFEIWAVQAKFSCFFIFFELPSMSERKAREKKVKASKEMEEKKVKSPLRRFHSHHSIFDVYCKCKYSF